ncbi:MAG: histidine kinase [Lewinellaceae bacterium]|nr:histidine kinase [Saprospiraceae bacterium]MCB9341478.1 histidine kinase [Lewinellaceae bacterium]
MKTCFHIALLWLAGNCQGQAPFFKAHELGEPFQQVKAGFVYEDYNGVLWFGTTGGLFLFDGIEFQPFLKTDSTSNHVRSIFRDSKKRFWVGYEDGSVYHLKGQKLRAWQLGQQGQNAPVNGFAEDGYGNIWISTYGDGVYIFDEKKLFHLDSTDGLPTNEVYVMTTDKAGQAWLGTDGGISACSLAGSQKSVKNYTTQDGLPDDIVLAILPNSEGKLWVGTHDGGVCLFDPGKESFEFPIDKQDLGIVKCLELFEGTDLWIGTHGNGVWRYSLQQGSLSHLPPFEQAKVTDLHKDIEGNIWVLTNARGIFSANRQFEFVATNFENVQAVLTDTKNRLWIGTPHGLYSHQMDWDGKSSFQQHLEKLNLNTVSLFEDEFGNIWIGTFGQGVYVYQPATGATRHISLQDGLVNGSIMSLAGQKKGQLWMATLAGATEISYSGDVLKNGALNIRHLGRQDGLGSSFLYKVFIDSKGRVWFGTDGQGVCVLENGRLKNFPIATHLQENGKLEEETRLYAVYSITEDQNGHIWLSTDRAGIFEFDGTNFQHLTVKEGIRDLEITSLATDANGLVLIVHPTGLDLLTPGSKHLIYYDEEVGMHDLNPNLNAVCTDRFGNVWIGAKNTIIKYSALKEDLEIDPRTLLNNVSVFLEPIDFNEVNVFSHRQNNLVFNYMGLWYTDPGIVKYRYRLTNYDLDWIESKDRRATYSNLPAGHYTFEVTSTENDAWLDEPIVSYSFWIKKPFWLRWWFIALALPAVTGLFVWYQRNRDKRIQLVNLLEKDKVESQLAALKAQINPHFLFNSFNTLITVIEENPKLAVEYVENLSDFYRKIILFRDKEIISMKEEIELVENFSFLLEKRYGSNFRLRMNIKNTNCYIVPFTLQLLVENAVKHNIISKSKPLNVDISSENGEYITVTNNLQLKLTQEKSTYFGLQSLVMRYDLLGKRKVKIEDTGNFYKVSVPLIQ